MTISNFLQSLRPSGDGSFEDLVGALLVALTGLRFYAARSGDQGGRDGRASGSAGGDIVFECKRYSGDTSLRDRELMGELAQAHVSLPELDVWIIAASREVTDQNLEGLQTFGKEHGIDIVPMESLPEGDGTLDFLVGPAPVLLADGSGPCPTPDKTNASPGCDTILTAGFAAYSTVENLANKYGYVAWYDSARVGATLYNPTSGTFYTYDDPAVVAAKMAYIKKYKLGGAYVWALNDDDASASLTKAIAADLK